MTQEQTPMDWSQLRSELLDDVSDRPLPPEIKVPVLPRAVSALALLADEPDVDSTRLASAIARDSGLTLELLRYVNSSALGVRHKVSNVVHAVRMLGIRGTKLFVLRSGVRHAMQIRESKVIHIPTFQASNLERALLAREFAALWNTDCELAFTGGTLQDFVLPLLANELHPIYLEYLSDEAHAEVDLVEFERSRIGWDHAELGARILCAWGFPDDLVCCVLCHHHGIAAVRELRLSKSAVAAVAVSAMMPDQMRQVKNGLDQLREVDRELSNADLPEMLRAVESQFQELAGENFQPLAVKQLLSRWTR